MLVAFAVVLFIWIPAAVTVRSLQPRTVSFASPPMTPDRPDGRGRPCGSTAAAAASFDIGTGVGHRRAPRPDQRPPDATRPRPSSRHATPPPSPSTRSGGPDDGLDLAVVVTGGPDVVPVELAPRRSEAGPEGHDRRLPRGAAHDRRGRDRGHADPKRDDRSCDSAPSRTPDSPAAHSSTTRGASSPSRTQRTPPAGQGLAIPVSQIRAAARPLAIVGRPVSAPRRWQRLADLPTCPA